ncbi:MAG: NAD(P)/FAD-dependent oxidoreductase [Dehalococcoidia bacterium]|nr:NAD(P)/FAD-dependent oxidoreductase [Dehalococcoidia bacterium]
MADKYEAIIIGAGPGGVTCSALLAKKGLKVLLLEKNQRVGGKGITVQSKGFKSEMFAMAGVPAHEGAWLEAFRALGIEDRYRVVAKPLALVSRHPGEKWQIVQTQSNDPDQQADPLAPITWCMNDKEKEISLRILAEIFTMSPERIAELDDVSVHDFITRYEDLPKPLYGFFAYLANTSMAGIIETASMAAQIRFMLSVMQKPLGYPKGGFGRMMEDMAEVLKAHNGEVKLRARVEKIVVTDGQVEGVLTKDGLFKAPIVVSNAGIQPTVLKLVGAEHFDRAYINYVKDLLPSLGFVCMRYLLNKPVLEYALYQVWSQQAWWNLEEYKKARAGKLTEDVIFTVSVPSNFDPEMAPPGKQIVVVGATSSPDPQDRMLKPVFAKMDQQMCEVFPEMVPHIESRVGLVGPAQISGISREQVMPGRGGEGVGLGMSVGQTGRNKPSARAPIRGLFYVGFDAGGRDLMGTHQAVDSGMNVAEIVHQYHRGKQQAGGK